MNQAKFDKRIQWVNICKYWKIKNILGTIEMFEHYSCNRIKQRQNLNDKWKKNTTETFECKTVFIYKFIIVQ